MTPRIVSQLGLALVLPAIAILALSIWRSVGGTPSAGLAGLGSVLLLLGTLLRMRARAAAR